MDKDAELNGKGRSLLTRITLLEEKVQLISWAVKALVGLLLGEVVVAVFVAYVLRR